MTIGPDPRAAAILATLATALPGEFLAQCFPDHSAQEIRQLLRAVATQLAPPGQAAAAAASRPPVAAMVAAPKPAAVVSERLLLFSDGASRGNPGLGGAGIQILNDERQEILAASKFLGQCTNNEAEYLALIFGLQEARRLGGRCIGIFLDSELIVRQLNGRYQVKNERLKALFAEVKRELAHFPRHTVSHVPRAQNQRADQMANRGIDERG